MARLPQPGADDGEWGTILNDFLLQSHQSDGALKTGSVGANQIADESLPQSKIEDLSTDLADKVNVSSIGSAGGVAELDGSMKVPISQLPTGIGGTQVAVGNHNHAISSLSDYNNGTPPQAGQSIVWNGSAYAPTRPYEPGAYPVEAYGFFAMSDAPANATFNGQLDPGELLLSRVWVPAGYVISRVGVVIQTAGTVGTGGQNCFAIYDDSGSLLAQSTSDNNLWTITGWVTAPLTSTIPAQNAGRFVYVATLVNGYSVYPFVLFNRTNSDHLMNGGYNVVNRRAIFRLATSALPASFAPASYGTTTSYLLLTGLA